MTATNQSLATPSRWESRLAVIREKCQPLVRAKAHAYGYLEQARVMKIGNAEQAAAVGEFLRSVKTLANELKEARLAQTRPIDDYKGEVMAMFREPAEQLEQAETIAKGALTDYQRQVQEDARRRQREIEENARKEQGRLRAEAEAKAKKAEAKGNTERAAQIRDTVPLVGVPVINTAPPKIAGIASKTTWKARIVDAALVPREFLVVNEQALQAFARTTKGVTPVAGVEFYEELGAAVR